MEGGADILTGDERERCLRTYVSNTLTVWSAPRTPTGRSSASAHYGYGIPITSQQPSAFTRPTSGPEPWSPNGALGPGRARSGTRRDSGAYTSPEIRELAVAHRTAGHTDRPHRSR